jgi:hypothetical protein
MDLLILIVLGGALLVLSGRWGYDSRENIRSKEQELAAWGFRWEGPSADAARELRARREANTAATPTASRAHHRAA